MAEALGRVYRGAAFHDCMPHRYENVLLDEARVLDAKVAEAELAVGRPDPAGRELFLRRAADGTEVLLEPVYAEHLALSSVCVLKPELAPGSGTIFSSISDFSLPGPEAPLGAGEQLLSRTERKNAPLPFRRFTGEFRRAGGAKLAEVELLAYIEEPGHAAAPAVEKREAPPLPAEETPVAPELFAWKDRRMRFVDFRVNFDPAARAATYRYTYPADHPLTRGHFPGRPVLMGICLWLAAADAAHALFSALGEQPAPEGSILSAEGTIVRPDGRLVAQVRGLALRERPGTDGGLAPPDLVATKTIRFLSLVLPGEPLFVRVRLK